MSQISKHIGGRIRNHRKNQGMTLQQLADLIHKSRATLSKYETGELPVDVETLYDIAAALHVDVTQIMDYQPERPFTAPISQHLK